MPLSRVTDLALLEQLNGPRASATSGAARRRVTDPTLLAQLNGESGGSAGRDEPPPTYSNIKGAASPISEPDDPPDWLRRIALGGRAVGQGVVETVSGLADAQTNLTNTISRFFGLPGQPTLSEQFSAEMDQAGAYRPETDDERLGYEATRGVSGALAGGAATGIRGARALASVATSGGFGGAAPEIVRQEGGGPVAQTVAGVGASLLPSGAPAAVAGTARRILRGGEAGRQRTARNIDSFAAAGAQPTAGQATEGRFLRSAESLLSRTPGAAGRMVRTAEQQAEDLGAGIERQAARLAPRSSAEQAGRAIDRGVSDSGGFLDRFKSKSAQLYNEIDRFVPGQQSVGIANTQRALAALTTPIKGAEATSRHLINQRIAAIAEDLGVDAQGGVLPYEALKRLRTMVGAELADAPLKGDVPLAQWKRLYAALSSDMQEAARAAGPQAMRAYTRADNYYRSGSRRMEVLEPILSRNGGPEAIFRAAVSGTREGASTIRATMQSLPADAQRMVSATVLRRLGRAKAGVQDDLGDKFSAETFLTNWSGMSPEAKAALFNRYGSSFRADMDQVAKVASNLRTGSQVFRNPSGTAQAATQQLTAGTIALAAISGNWAAAGSVAAGVAGSNIVARALTNPTFVRWLAMSTRAPVNALPSLIQQLGRHKDPELQELAALLENAPHGPN